MANPRTYVEAPPVTPLPYGLSSAALVLDDLEGNAALGVHYEPSFCGPAEDSRGACQDAPDFGTISVSVSSAALATLTAAGEPTGTTYTIDWGDDTLADTATLDGQTHTYAAPGAYVVHITDNRLGYVATVTVTVTAGQATGPFAADAGFAKIPHEGIPLVDGEPFNLYHLFRCQAVGAIGDMQDRARAALRLGEGRALERVTAQMLALGFTDGTDRVPAVDLTPTPGTAVHPAVGVALLEEFAGDQYGGVPVLHTGRRAGSLLGTAGTIIRNANRLETVQGAIVAAGGGYTRLVGPPTDLQDPTTVQPAGPGQAWLYVTGTVVIRRAPVIEVGPVMSRTPATNVAEMLAERPHVVTWECITGAVLVDTTVVD